MAKNYVLGTKFMAIDAMSAPIAKMAASMSGLTTIAGTSGALITRNLQTIENKAQEIGMKSGMLAAGLLIPLGLAAKEAMDFEKQMGNIATIVDTSKESITDMGDAILNLSTKMPVRINDLTESMYQIRSAGVAAADAMDVLQASSKLSIAGLSSATDATKAVTSAMVNFKQQGMSTAEIANSFFLTVKEGKTKMEGLNESFGNNAPIVASAGIKLQEFNAATAAMTNSGMSASEAQNGIRMSVLALLNPTTEMTKLFEKLGVASGEELIKKTGGLSESLDAIAEASKKMNMNAPNLFNKTALTAYTLLSKFGNLHESFKQNKIEQLGGADNLSDAFEKQQQTSAAQFQILINVAQGLAIQLGNALLPALNKLMGGFVNVIKPITWLLKHVPLLSESIVTVVGAVGTFAAGVAIVSAGIWTWTKAIWLLNIAQKSLMFIEGALSVVNGTMTGTLLTSTLATKGATAALWAMDLSAQGLLATLARISLFVAPLLVMAKLLDRQHEAKDRMKAVMEHLPENVDKDKFSKQFQDIIHPGYVSPTQRLMGVKDEYPQEMFDSLSKKYYDEPKAKQDSALNNMQTIVLNQTINVDKDGKQSGKINNKATSGQTSTIDYSND